jgi:hypothetical protein
MLQVEATATRSGRTVGMALRNVSWAGFRMASSLHLLKGEPLRIRIPVVDPQYSIEAEVVWCLDNKGDEYEIGVQFRSGNCLLDETMYSHLREIETYRQTVRDIEGREIDSDQAAEEWRDRFSQRFFS